VPSFGHRDPRAETGRMSSPGAGVSPADGGKAAQVSHVTQPTSPFYCLGGCGSSLELSVGCGKVSPCSQASLNFAQDALQGTILQPPAQNKMQETLNLALNFSLPVKNCCIRVFEEVVAPCGYYHLIFFFFPLLIKTRCESH